MNPHRGVLILVLGIVSLGPCCLTGPFAWILGKRDLEEIDEGRLDPEGRGLTQAGMVCGIVGTALCALALLYLIVVIPLLYFSASAE